MATTVNKASKQRDIIKHAAEQFAQNGYHETKIQDVATAADIGKGTVYEYFRTKEELFLGVYDFWMSEYEAMIEQRVSMQTDAMGKVDAIRESAIDFYESRAEQAPLFLEFWAHALRTDNPAFLERINRTRGMLRTMGAELAQQLVDSGWFTDLDAATFALLETGINDGIFLTWVLEGRSFSLKKAYTFRQSLIGLGLLTDDARDALRFKLSEKLKQGV